MMLVARVIVPEDGSGSDRMFGKDLGMFVAFTQTKGGICIGVGKPGPCWPQARLGNGTSTDVERVATITGIYTWDHPHLHHIEGSIVNISVTRNGRTAFGMIDRGRPDASHVELISS